MLRSHSPGAAGVASYPDHGPDASRAMTTGADSRVVRALLRALLFLAVAFSMAMAVVSTTEKAVHHDEFDHFNAARYYTEHWLPPAVGDAKARESHSIYGYSYLNEWDVVYALAGKFAALINPWVGDIERSLRFFNVALFLALGCLALVRRSAVLGFAVLLTSPQIWYTFGYFNGDAFPFFLCFVIVAALTTPAACGNESRGAVVRCLVLGCCVGLLIVSKKSFWSFALFTVVLVGWMELQRYRRDHDAREVLRHLGVFAVTIAAMAGPRIAYDLHLNGSSGQKQAKIVALAEELAAPIFKPSTSTKQSLNLRSKGVSLAATLRPPYDWAKHSFHTLFGAYNYNVIRPNRWYFDSIIGAYGLFLVYLVSVVWTRGGAGERFVLGAATATAALVVALSLYHSWVGDFQPQGRYLFGMFALVAIVLARNQHRLRRAAVQVFIAIAFLLSAWSFTNAGLAFVPKYRSLEELSPREFIRPR
jgi:hypothetical protein